MTAQVDQSLLDMDLVEDGDLVVIAAGSPPGKAGSTNSLKVHKVGTGEATAREKLGPWPERRHLRNS